jgi:hypothetical protein
MPTTMPADRDRLRISMFARICWFGDAALGCGYALAVAVCELVG